MNKDKKITLGLIGGALLTVSALVGSVAGSLAWYAYSRQVLFSYVGTSVQKSVLLNVGLVDDDHYLSDAKVEQYDLVRELHDGHSIVFTHSSNGLETQAIIDYLTASPYATNMLFPVTTRDRAIDATGALTLYKSPDYGETSITREAVASEYVKLPFAFKIDDETSAHISNKSVWLTEAVVQASGEHINESVRVFVENSQRKFLMKPLDQSMTTGETKVGGLLDLDGDQTYDFDKLHNNEYYYGDYTGSLVNEPTEYGIPFDEADFENVNNVVPPQGESLQPSTFYAKHNEHAKIVDRYYLTPKAAAFETFGTVKPMVTENGVYYSGETGIPLCSTESASGIGYCTMTIFIEGWDHSVVDKAAGYSFNLGLRFETNRL